MAVLRIVIRILIRWKVGSVLVCWYGSVDNCQPHFDNMEGGQRADMAVLRIVNRILIRWKVGSVLIWQC